MASLLLGKYLPVDSIIHRMDVRVKLLSTMLFIVAIFITKSNVVLLLLFIPIILLSIIGKIGIKNILFSIKSLRVMIIFMVIFNLFLFKSGSVIFQYKFIIIYDDAIYRSIFFILRISTMVMYTSILTLTTKPIELSDGIESLLKPLEIIKVPAHTIGMMISIALRFIPTLFEETQKIMNAQASRGIDFKNGKLKEKIQGIVALLVPLFVSSIRRADDLANAMEIRGYVDGKGRTDLIERNITKNEILYFTFHIIIVIIIVSIRLRRLYEI